MDDESKALFTWILDNAFPKEISFGEMNSMDASFAIEELVIAHQKLSFESN